MQRLFLSDRFSGSFRLCLTRRCLVLDVDDEDQVLNLWNRRIAWAVEEDTRKTKRKAWIAFMSDTREQPWNLKLRFEMK